jgi:hypothetical protein
VLFAQCGQCGAVLKALSQNVFRECNEVWNLTWSDVKASHRNYSNNMQVQ